MNYANKARKQEQISQELEEYQGEDSCESTQQM